MWYTIWFNWYLLIVGKTVHSEHNPTQSQTCDSFREITISNNPISICSYMTVLLQWGPKHINTSTQSPLNIDSRCKQTLEIWWPNRLAIQTCEGRSQSNEGPPELLPEYYQKCQTHQMVPVVNERSWAIMANRCTCGLFIRISESVRANHNWADGSAVYL